MDLRLTCVYCKQTVKVKMFHPVGKYILLKILFMVDMFINKTSKQQFIVSKIFCYCDSYWTVRFLKYQLFNFRISENNTLTFYKFSLNKWRLWLIVNFSFIYFETRYRVLGVTQSTLLTCQIKYTKLGENRYSFLW